MADTKPTHGGGKREALSIVLLAICVIVFLSLVSYDWRDISLLHEPPNTPPANFIGPGGAWVSFILFGLLGLGAYLLPLWFLGFGIVLIFHGIEHIRAKLVWAAMMMVTLAGILELHADWFTSFMSALNISAVGGVPAQFVVRLVSVNILGDVGTNILIISLFVAASILFFGWDAILRMWAMLHQTATKLATREPGDMMDPQKRQPAIKAWKRERIERVAAREETLRKDEDEDEDPEQGELIAIPKPEKPASRIKEKPAAPEPPPPPPPPPKPVVIPKPEPKPAPPPPPPPAPPPPPLAPGAYQLPPMSLLTEVPANRQGPVQGDTDATARIIIQTLEEFGIKTELKTVECGPSVARYELIPPPGVKVEKIASLSNNLALSLKANSIRVQAPIPGKGTVGIEVPNSATSTVYLREILEGSHWQPSRMEIPIVLGKDVGGNDLVADLATMPHLLVAGATGSGKTVCMNSILAGLFMARTPEQLQLMLIDPKIVEFSVYNHLPHLLGARNEVITDPKRVAGALRWAITEMERRYRIMAKAGVRNIKSYNARPVEKQASLFGDGEEGSKLPDRLSYIVIIVDELADLMMTAQAEIENYIARLAQLSRAVGIHMILATQRPSVDVITGTIKANFPARIAFQVAQKNDSRTILDANGADKLLGRGDMLFLPPGASKLIRAQGALTSDEDIRKIVDFIKKQCPTLEDAPAPEGNGKKPDASRGGAAPAPTPEAKPAPSFDEMLAKGGDDAEDDQLIEMAVQIIRETQRASTSSLQRRLRIGYTRAARIMDELEKRGMVGPARGSDPREILIDLDGQMPGNPGTEQDEQP
jgi:S-DNA-T family DNA segregation ATPase FtsK/SpoIIIE